MADRALLAGYHRIDLQFLAICVFVQVMMRNYDIIKWKHFLLYWPFVRGIHWSPVDSSHTGQCCGALMRNYGTCFPRNGCANSRDAGEFKPLSTHCNITVISFSVAKIFLRYGYKINCGEFLYELLYYARLGYQLWPNNSMVSSIENNLCDIYPISNCCVHV